MKDKGNSSGPEVTRQGWRQLCSPARPAQAPDSPEQFHYRTPSAGGRASVLFHDNWMKECRWEHNSFQGLMNYLLIKETQRKGRAT